MRECLRYVRHETESEVHRRLMDNFLSLKMASYIYAALDAHSEDWTDYTSASSAYLPVTATASSHSLDAPDAHIPSYMRAAEDINNGVADERLADAVRAALPSIPDVFAPPSLSLPEMGVWTCPECGFVVDPWDLTLDGSALIGTYLGMGTDCGVLVSPDGRTQLDSANPWLFMRSVDCLGWTHLAEHLKRACVTFWFPNPVSAYKVCPRIACYIGFADGYQCGPGLWWDEVGMQTHMTHVPLRLEIEALERSAQYTFRMWRFKKMISIAEKGLHSARFELTRWRREAVRAREILVRGMFVTGRGIVDTGFALVHHMDREQNDASRMRLQQARDEYRTLKSDWLRRRDRWARIYLE